MQAKPDRCPACKRRVTRSSEANRRLWALYHRISEVLRPLDQTYSAEQWHLYFKTRFLGADDVKLPNNKVIVIPRSTADLDTSAFNDYMTAVESWANEKGCYLEDGIFA